MSNYGDTCIVDGKTYVFTEAAVASSNIARDPCIRCAGWGSELCAKLGDCFSSCGIWKEQQPSALVNTPAPAWTPIDQIKNKEDGRSVLLLNDGYPVVGYWEEPTWADCRECMSLIDVTHFIEIPSTKEL